MPLTLEVSMQGYNNLRDLKAELPLIKSQEPEDIMAWAESNPDSAWGRHLKRNSAKVLVEYVRSLVQVVVMIDQPAPPKPIQVDVTPIRLAPKPSKLHEHVKPVSETKQRAQLQKFFKAFAPLRLAYADVPELQNLFAEAERIRRAFNIF